MTFKILISIACILVGVLMGIVVAPKFTEDLKETCHTFIVGTSNDPATVWIGEVEMCGKDIKWGNVKGPIDRTEQPRGYLR